jgi:hypothetical protein
MSVLLVIVHDLDVFGSGGSLAPFETHSPLVVGADAVLALPIALQRFEAIPGQGRQIFERRRRIESVDLQTCRALDT